MVKRLDSPRYRIGVERRRATSRPPPPHTRARAHTPQSTPTFCGRASARVWLSGRSARTAPGPVSFFQYLFRWFWEDAWGVKEHWYVDRRSVAAVHFTYVDPSKPPTHPPRGEQPRLRHAPGEQRAADPFDPRDVGGQGDARGRQVQQPRRLGVLLGHPRQQPLLPFGPAEELSCCGRGCDCGC